MRSRSTTLCHLASTVTRTVAGAAVAFLLSLGGAAAQDYGPLRGSSLEGMYFSKINKNGVTAWRLKAEEALRARGFSDEQVKKFSRLQYVVQKEDREKGRIEFDFMSLPVIYHLETGKVLPIDPVAYAAALPDCLKQDERTCNFVYSSQTMDQSGREKPCLLPKRTIAFCKRVGFGNVYKRGGGSIYAASCGEGSRTNGCGADEAVFDDGSEQTKLTFSIEKALAVAESRPTASAAAPGSASAPGGAPAASPAPNASAAPAAAAFPRIVYRAGKDVTFLRREGPPEREEWEYDVVAYQRVQKRQSELYDLEAKRPNDRKLKAEQASLSARLDALRKPAINYCWPHDVFQPCDLE